MCCRGTLREMPKAALRRADAVVLHHIDLLGGWGGALGAAAGTSARTSSRPVQCLAVEVLVIHVPTVQC